MSRNCGSRRRRQQVFQPLIEHLLRQWEEIFFLFLFVLLCLQDFSFLANTKHIALPAKAAINAFASFERFIFDYFRYISIPLVASPLVVMIIRGEKGPSNRRFLDAVGAYIVIRMFIQLAGLNLLLFNTITPGLVLITQLLLFLPYSLLVWGWIYWRIDESVGVNSGKYFRLDCEREKPRPIDYLVASFSTVFSASISSIKGKSARAKILTIIHGFVVYDLMGLTLSRAISLAQAK